MQLSSASELLWCWHASKFLLERKATDEGHEVEQGFEVAMRMNKAVKARIKGMKAMKMNAAWLDGGEQRSVMLFNRVPLEGMLVAVEYFAQRSF